jgi:hypothetical protein
MKTNRQQKEIAERSPSLPAENEEPSFSWKAPEYEHEEKHPRWYILMGGILLAVIIYALVTNSLLMAITFILIGMLGYIYAEREPRMIQMEINSDGIQVDNYFYKYEDLKSFWIFYEVEENIKLLSFHSKKTFLPHIHVPVGGANPILIREVLVAYLPEIRQELTIIDRLERMIGL